MRSLVQSLFRFFLSLLPGEVALSIIHYRAHKQWPNLRQPRTFNEKVQYRKLHQHDPRFPQLADKAIVKKYVEERLGKQWVIPTLWVGAQLPPRITRQWPIPYVVKATHGSSTNFFVRTEAEQDWNRIESLSAGWLRQTYGKWTREWLYTVIEPRLLVEPFVARTHELPLDYKFFVFDGVVKYIQVDTGREHLHQRALYTPDWKPVEVRFSVDRPSQPLDRPASLEAMITAAQTLGQGFDFVRVDLYEIEGRPLFGELTFYPDSGLGTFTPASFDQTLGALWKLPTRQ